MIFVLHTSLIKIVHSFIDMGALRTYFYLLLLSIFNSPSSLPLSLPFHSAAFTLSLEQTGLSLLLRSNLFSDAPSPSLTCFLYCILMTISFYLQQPLACLASISLWLISSPKLKDVTMGLDLHVHLQPWLCSSVDGKATFTEPLFNPFKLRKTWLKDSYPNNMVKGLILEKCG